MGHLEPGLGLFSGSGSVYPASVENSPRVARGGELGAEGPAPLIFLHQLLSAQRRRAGGELGAGQSRPWRTQEGSFLGPAAAVEARRTLGAPHPASFLQECEINPPARSTPLFLLYL